MKGAWVHFGSLFPQTVSNTDDHLRNHGFLLTSGGWSLSPLYDVNPIPYGHELSLNITYDSAEMSLAAAVETAPLYEITTGEAKHIIREMAQTILQSWQLLAKTYHIKSASIERMRPAFTLADAAGR